jgi:hypothetical protein
VDAVFMTGIHASAAKLAAKRLKGDAACFVELLGCAALVANRISNKNPSDHNRVVGHVAWH